LGAWQKLKIFLNVGGYYNELANFYPYHPVIKGSKEMYEEDVASA